MSFGHFIPLGILSYLDKMTYAQCIDSTQKSQKIVSKTCSSFSCLTIRNWGALLESPKWAVHKWIHILESSEICNFWWNFLPWLAWNLVSPMIRQDSLSHWSRDLHLPLEKPPQAMVLAFTCILGLENHSKLVDFWCSLNL